MASRLKIYLDTSVINFLYAYDAPEKMEITIEFFENFVKPGIYETYISKYVIAEILDHPDAAAREKLLDVINAYYIETLVIEETEKIEMLAQEYISNGVIPEKKIADAYHIAVSVLSGINYLVSWNFKHLANVNKEKMVKIVNLENNYPTELRIITPLELMDYGSENI